MAAPVSINLTCPTVDKSGSTLQQLATPWPGMAGNSNGLIYNNLTPKMSAYFPPEILMNETERNKACVERTTRLITAKIIPPLPDAEFFDQEKNESNLKEHENKIVNFQKRLASEYCYYENNYIGAIKKFMTLYMAASAGDKNSKNVEDAKKVALDLNLILNTLIAMMNHLSSTNRNLLRSLSSSVNIYNSDIKNSQDKLIKQAQILNSSSKDSEIFKQMVEYTAEKNRASQNMLSLYFTLNVIAIAGLFVIARNL